MPDENQVSRTSSSETQEQELSDLYQRSVELIQLGESVMWQNKNRLNHLDGHCGDEKLF